MAPAESRNSWCGIGGAIFITVDHNSACPAAPFLSVGELPFRSAPIPSTLSASTRRSADQGRRPWVATPKHVAHQHLSPENRASVATGADDRRVATSDVAAPPESRVGSKVPSGSRFDQPLRTARAIAGRRPVHIHSIAYLWRFSPPFDLAQTRAETICGVYLTCMRVAVTVTGNERPTGRSAHC
jgi:hypothetical protein